MYPVFHAFCRYYDTLSPEDQQTQSNGSSFREVVAFLDGVPVGAIFHQPLVYSGGMNPLFWRPFMAMGSLNMPTYTLDVTPFLGRLLGGGAHRIEFGVAAAGPGSSWITAGALKVWTDPKVTATSAGLSFAKVRTGRRLVPSQLAPGLCASDAVWPRHGLGDE